MYENLKRISGMYYFEYHCLESPSSCDAQLWYRSHQKVKVLSMDLGDGEGIYSYMDRMEGGTPIIYKVKFKDGFIHDVFEDELLNSPSEYERPDPPKINKESIQKVLLNYI